jgi:hypothetical protein
MSQRIDDSDQLLSLLCAKDNIVVHRYASFVGDHDHGRSIQGNMMKRTHLYLIMSILLALVLLSIYKALPISSTASIASTPDISDKKPKTLTPMVAPSVTHGNTRITLIHLARTTSWSNESIRGHGDRQGPMYALPGVYMEFVVEQLDEVSTQCGLTGITTKLLQDGRLTSESSQVILGGASVNENYSPQSQRFGFKPPVVKNERKSLILQHHKRGVALDSGQVTIRVTAAIDDDECLFVFKDIPLN